MANKPLTPGSYIFGILKIGIYLKFVICDLEFACQ